MFQCRKELEIIRRLLGGIAAASADQTVPDKLPSEPLPPEILRKVEERKQKWILTRAKRVLDFHPAKKPVDETARLKKLLEDTDDSLPLAAFPDDLTEKNGNGEEDD